MRVGFRSYLEGGRPELTGVQDLDPDLVGARGSDLDLLDLERLACAPADGGLARNGLSCGVGHGGVEQTRREKIAELSRVSPPRADIIAEPSPNQFSLGRADAGLSFSFRGLVSLSVSTTISSVHPASHHLHLTRRTQREESCLSPICITRGCV